MASITQVDDAKMQARANIANWRQKYNEQYFGPLRKTLVAANWATMTPEQRQALRQANPVLHDLMKQKMGG